MKALEDAIARGADINQKDGLGCTPLMHAADKGYMDIVKYLHENNSDLNVQNDSGWTSLMYAAENGCDDIVEYLCTQRNVDLNVQSEVTKETAVILAARYNEPSCLKILVKAGAVVSLKTSAGVTALDLANNECQEILTEQICRNNTLWKAIGARSLNDVKAAIASGADINARGSSGWTPLMQTVENGSKDILEFLCENNADLNVQSDDTKDTAVTLAARSNKHSYLKTLIKYQADVSLETTSGLTALDIAKRKPNKKSVQILMKELEKVRTIPERGQLYTSHLPMAIFVKSL